MYELSPALVIEKIFCAAVRAGCVFIGTVWYISKKIANRED
jgi:hypothetical protein|nr:MAG TPA: hypothetical protein [Caudoviricetes sp.]